MLTKECGSAGRRHLPGNGRRGECMGKREDRRYGWRLAVLIFVLLCLQGTGGQAYAQEDKAGERRIRYSSSYLKEAEIPEAPEEYLEEGEITYRLVGTEIEAVPVCGRTREVSGEMVYPSVTREQEIPARAPMEVEDRESRKTVSVMLDLKRTSYENEHWQDGFEISVVFHEYGADTYRLGGTVVMHDEKVPPLEACREELLASAGLSEDEVQIESASWEGDAYQDEAGIWCRNAAVQAKRRVWDCRAVYGGTVRLPAYERYRRRMEYEKAEPDVEEMTEIEADPGTLVETETAPVENLPLPFWRRWIHYGLTISVSLLLLLLAWLGFRQLRRMAREKNER